MEKKGLLIHYDYCTGCHSCEVACQQEHDFPAGKCGIRVTEHIYEALKKPVAIDYVITSYSIHYTKLYEEDLIMDRIADIRKEHHNLFEAIAVKDVERAKELVRFHHGNSKKSLFPIIFPKN